MQIEAVDEAGLTETGLAAALTAAASRGFDLSRETPLRAQLFELPQSELGDNDHVLLILLHHIAGDGWSLGPLWRDLTALYRARHDGVPAALSPLPVQYADYTLWQRAVLGEESDPASAIARQLSFWKTALDGLPEQIELPADRPRPAISSHRGGHVPLVIPAGLHGQLAGLAQRSGASLFMVLQAALTGLLSRLGGGTDIAIGSPIAGRTDAALDDLIGFFVNTLVLRTDLSGQPSFHELIGRVRSSNLSAYAHQDLPFERLVEVLNPARSLSRHPLFQVMLAFETQTPGAGPLDLAGLKAEPQPIATATAKFDLSLGLTEHRSADGRPAGIDGVLEYASDLFDRGTVETIGARLLRLLAAAAADAARPLGALPILDDAERDTIIAAVERHRRPGAAGDLARAVRAAGRADAGRHCRDVRGQELELRSARRPRQPPGASSARARRWTRDRGWRLPRALPRNADRAPWHPQGRRRLSAARPELPARAPRLHAGRCRRRGAGDASRAARHAARHTGATWCCSMPTGRRSHGSPTPRRK